MNATRRCLWKLDIALAGALYDNALHITWILCFATIRYLAHANLH
jgi:hypothetical protein